MPKEVRITLETEEFRRMKEAKGNRTWREVLKDGASCNE